MTHERTRDALACRSTRRFVMPYTANTVFITSGMKRTEETLQLLFGDVPHKTDIRFKEINFGIFEMKSYNELKDTAEYQQWIAGDNHTNIPPKGESGLQMEHRVLKAFEEIKISGKDTIIITHGGVIAAIMVHYFKERSRIIEIMLSCLIIRRNRV